MSSRFGPSEIAGPSSVSEKPFVGTQNALPRCFTRALVEAGGKGEPFSAVVVGASDPPETFQRAPGGAAVKLECCRPFTQQGSG